MTSSMIGARDAARPPLDAAGFIAAAEYATNAYDLEAILAVYARDARLEVITDGALEIHHGTPEVQRAWSVYLDVMRRGSLSLRKQLVAANGLAIANRWEGTLDGKACRGVETWHLDANGEVREHRMYSYLNVQPAARLGMRLRLLVAYPKTALRFLLTETTTRSCDDCRHG